MTDIRTSQLLGNGTAVELDPEPVPSADGTAEVYVGRHRFPDVADANVGIWAVEPGTITGVTKNEIFVVLVGRATVHFHDTDEIVHVGPGDVVQLHKGQRNTWTTHEFLRKLYVNTTA